MFNHENSDQNIPTGIEAYYEAVASQEEIYLEEMEEELRVILASDDPPSSRSESPDQQRERFIEELITGDSDDPAVAEEAMEAMLRTQGIRQI